ncbi:MAG: TetR/AcrR family transcriptional regulator [Victivallales bacterium]|nr:TetR/AcrR family transcriptional regulator [Victivallales bacterium]
MPKDSDTQFMTGHDGQEKTRNRILSVAAMLFSEKGFEGTSVRMICAKAGVNVSLVNYYFKSKELLYFEVHKLINLHLTEQMPWANGEPEPVRSLDEWEARLQGIISGILKVHLTKDKYSVCRRRLFSQEMSRPSKCLPMLMEYLYNPFKAYLESFFRLACTNLPEKRLNLMIVFLMNQVIGFLRLVPPWDAIICPGGLAFDDWLADATSLLAHMLRREIEDELKDAQ